MTLGKPDAGKPLVRFDEGRSRTVIGLRPLNPSAPPTLQVRASAGLAAPEELHESRLGLRVPEAELLALHDVLDELAMVDEEAARLVKLRYFVGMSMAEAVEALEIPRRQGERLWTFAKAWLRDAIRRDR